MNGTGGAGAKASAGAAASTSRDTAPATASASAPRARPTLVPGMSLHGGISGSRYDRLQVKPLSGASFALGTTIKALVESNRERRARGTDGDNATSPRNTLTSADREMLLAAQEQAGARSAGRQTPAVGCKLLDQAHLDTLGIIFSLLDTDLDGKLTDGQLRTAVTAVGIPPTRRFLLKLKRLAGHGGVDFDSFVRGVEEQLISDPIDWESVDELFHVAAGVDPRDGVASLADVQHVLAGIQTTHHTELGRDEVSDIMAELHIPRGEPIGVRDFVKALSSGFVQFQE